MLLNLLMLLFTGIIIYLTYSLGNSLKHGGTGVFQDLCWLLERTPALDTLLMFVVQAVLVASAVLCSFGSISKHIVISLDIIFFISMLMLILYHALKESDHNLVKK